MQENDGTAMLEMSRIDAAILGAEQRHQLRNAHPLLGESNQEAARLRDLKKRFTHHPPKGDQLSRYQRLRDNALNLALDIFELTPVSREQALALTKLEEAVMHANSAIARNE